MKPKLISLVASALALSFATTSVNDKPVNSEYLTKQSSLLSNLKLTSDQQAQFHKIHQEMRLALDKIIDIEQQHQFQENLEQGGNLNTALVAMDLSNSQQQQVRTIFQATQIQLVTLITLEEAIQLLKNLRISWNQALRVKPTAFCLQTSF